MLCQHLLVGAACTWVRLCPCSGPRFYAVGMCHNVEVDDHPFTAKLHGGFVLSCNTLQVS
eukprot:m.236412 g.236412  ORF g.236412 m.236412 type:complete len:60 (+) comp13921_c1_seq20:247-426(+)